VSITLELRDVSKHFGPVTAIRNVNLTVTGGEVTCLLGDNGAGKSTLIKVLSGVHAPSSGSVVIDGEPVQLQSPRRAHEYGIATVHQDVGTFPLMSVTRNFFLGREPLKGRGPFRRIDMALAERTAVEQLASMGISRVTSGRQEVGTLSGGERQSLSIARALHFGAKVLILDEPTSSLGVKEAAMVLRMVEEVRARGLAVVFITHNARHAMTVGDRFSVLIHGAVAAEFSRGERSREELLNLMAGGEEMEALEAEFEGLRDPSPRNSADRVAERR
jgi:simple sugar transport system ATP-binding protein